MAGTVSSAGSIQGLVSGMSTDDIVAKMMDIEKQPLTGLQTRQAALKTQLSAWQETNTRVLALKVKSDALASAVMFNTRTLNTSDQTAMTGSASSDAASGTYVLTVNALARANELKSAGYADVDHATVGTGTLSIKIGTGAAKDIKIDSTNNTLTAVAGAINKANVGVTAAVVNDGSATNPYRLLITSNTTGTAGQAVVTANLTGGTDPAFSTLQAAQDASVTLGEGDGALTFTKSTNSINDLIPSATLNLIKADPKNPITVSIGSDATYLKQQVQSFVDQYNNVVSFLNTQSAYNADTNTGGTLFADSSVENIQADLIQTVSDPVSGLGQSIKLLSQIGVTMNSDNTLSVSPSDLDTALQNNMDAVKRLFATVGDTSNANIRYIGSTGKTQVSSASGYDIQITAVATQARVTAGAAQTSVLAKDETLVLNGQAIELTAGMGQTSVVAKINEYTGKSGVMASATGADGTGTGNYLTLVSGRYGSAPTISVSSTQSNGGATPSSDTTGIGNVAVTQSSAAGETGTGTGAAGLDVAGTINGEAATGAGQYLTGNTGNVSTEGLKLYVSAQNTGDYGSITFTKGLASNLSDFLDGITQAGTGSVMTVQDSLTTQISNYDTEINNLQAKLDLKQQQLTDQFVKMESAMSALKNQGDYLTSQFAQMSANAAAAGK